MKDEVNDAALMQITQRSRLHAEKRHIMWQERTRSGQKQRKDSGEHKPQRHQHQQRTAIANQSCQQPYRTLRREGRSGVSIVHL